MVNERKKKKTRVPFVNIELRPTADVCRNGVKKNEKNKYLYKRTMVKKSKKKISKKSQTNILSRYVIFICDGGPRFIYM